MTGPVLPELPLSATRPDGLLRKRWVSYLPQIGSKALLLTREELDEIRAALPALTARERIALAGVLNDRTHRELAAEHDTTRKAIASAVQRARTKLAAGGALAA